MPLLSIKMKIKSISLLFAFALSACNSDPDVIKNISSEDPLAVIQGYESIERWGDTSFVKFALRRSQLDYRIVNNIGHKGESVFQSKMHALKSVFHNDPPCEITSDVDSCVYNFYFRFAKMKGCSMDDTLKPMKKGSSIY